MCFILELSEYNIIGFKHNYKRDGNRV